MAKKHRSAFSQKVIIGGTICCRFFKKITEIGNVSGHLCIFFQLCASNPRGVIRKNLYMGPYGKTHFGPLILRGTVSIFSFVWNLPNVDKPWNIFDDQLTNGTLQDVLRVLKAFIIILYLFIVQSGQSHPSPFSQPISQDLGPDEATPLTNDWKCRLIIKLLKIVDASKLALSQ